VKKVCGLITEDIKAVEKAGVNTRCYTKAVAKAEEVSKDKYDIPAEAGKCQAVGPPPAAPVAANIVAKAGVDSAKKCADECDKETDCKGFQF